MILLISRLVARLITSSLAVYWCLLFVGTHLPAKALVDTGVSDKWLHLLSYMGLAFLLACTVTAYRLPRLNAYLWMAAVLLIYGALDELSQIPVPGRHADFDDWLANAKGIASGLILHRIALSVYEYWPAWGAERRETGQTSG
jgi:VanZ family protein